MISKTNHIHSQAALLQLNETALLLSCTDFRDEQAAAKALQQAEQVLITSSEGVAGQYGHRLINIIHTYHLAVSNKDRQFFGYALQKAFREWMSGCHQYFFKQ